VRDKRGRREEVEPLEVRLMQLPGLVVIEPDERNGAVDALGFSHRYFLQIK
jgi:hypothetical protein